MMRTVQKIECHAREGGHPIFFSFCRAGDTWKNIFGFTLWLINLTAHFMSVLRTIFAAVFMNTRMDCIQVLPKDIASKCWFIAKNMQQLLKAYTAKTASSIGSVIGKLTISYMSKTVNGAICLNHSIKKENGMPAFAGMTLFCKLEVRS